MNPAPKSISNARSSQAWAVRRCHPWRWSHGSSRLGGFQAAVPGASTTLRPRLRGRQEVEHQVSPPRHAVRQTPFPARPCRPAKCDRAGVAALVERGYVKHTCCHAAGEALCCWRHARCAAARAGGRAARRGAWACSVLYALGPGPLFTSREKGRSSLPVFAQHREQASPYGVVVASRMTVREVGREGAQHVVGTR